jgi:hypothetical protein
VLLLLLFISISLKAKTANCNLDCSCDQAFKVALENNQGKVIYQKSPDSSSPKVYRQNVFFYHL